MKRVKGGLLFIFLGLLVNVASAQERARKRSRSPGRSVSSAQQQARKRTRSPGRSATSAQQQARKRTRSPGRSATSAQQQASKRAKTSSKRKPVTLRERTSKVVARSDAIRAAAPKKKSDAANLKRIRERIAQLKLKINAKAAQEKQALVGLDTVEVALEDVENITEDHFTQSEAHLSEQSVRYLIKKNYNVEMYLNVISQVVAKEQEYKDTHYAFYHALDNVWISTQDVYKKLHAYLVPMTVGVEDFQFLRWGSIGYEGTAQEFLVDQLKNHGLVDDNKGSTQAFLLSVNLALFGNVGYPGECTWQYFIKPTSHAQPNRAIFKSILDVFGIDNKYINELMKLSDLIKTKEQTLLQILVPIEKVDEIAYLSLVRGIPAHEQSINWVLKNIKSKRYQHVKPVLDQLTSIYKTEAVNNPAFKDLLDQVEKGGFSVNQLLKIYRNTPWKIDNINYLQARLILNNDVLLSPDSDVRFFRHSTITRKQLKAYNKALDKLIQKIVEEHLQKKAQELNE